MLDTRTAIIMMKLNTYTNTNIIIKHLVGVSELLTSNILKQQKYRKLESLDISGYQCPIQDSDILNFTKIKKLNASANPKITNINHMIHIIECNISSFICGVSDSGICDLKYIKILNACYNPKIININYMIHIETLLIGGQHCGVSDSGICDLYNIKKLYASNNPKITNINHMTKMEDCNVSYKCGVADNAYRNPKITNIKHMTKIEDYNISGHDCDGVF